MGAILQKLFKIMIFSIFFAYHGCIQYFYGNWSLSNEYQPFSNLDLKRNGILFESRGPGPMPRIMPCPTSGSENIQFTVKMSSCIPAQPQKDTFTFVSFFFFLQEKTYDFKYFKYFVNFSIISVLCDRIRLEEIDTYFFKNFSK